jgi:chorismate--pyruvate lyase
VTAAATAYAQWTPHVNGVAPPAHMRHWLSDRASLTLKLSACCQQFRVQRLRQRRGFCLADEFTMIGLARRQSVREREVLLQCDGAAVVFAHTIVPLTATALDWPFFSSLGERSLGTTLFGDPQVARGALQFARLHSRHPLSLRASLAIGVEKFDGPLFARRCLYQRKKGLLLVTEVFLPALDQLKLPHQYGKPQHAGVAARIG